MCGHVGVAGHLTPKSGDVFEMLLTLDEVRGEHATGIALVPSDGDKRLMENTIIHKMPIAAYNFIRNEYTQDLLRVPGKYSVMLGHNRHATLGTKSVNNSHPFAFEGLVGAHNGTVRLSHREDIPYKGPVRGTDSETLLASFNDHGVQETIAEIYDGTWSDSAWAFVWYNYDENRICFLRNEHRPLYYAFTEDEKQLYWASEAAMLHYACGRNGIKLNKVYELPVDTLFDVQVPTAAGELFNTDDLFTTERGAVKTKGKKPVTQWSRPSYGGHGARTDCSNKNLTSNAVVPFNHPDTALMEFLSPFHLTKEDLLNNTINGPVQFECLQCAEPIEPSEDSYSINGNDVWCESCADETKKKLNKAASN